MLVKTAILNNRVEMPLIGMGTYPLNKLRLALLIAKALKKGYRSIDTASAYGNERWVGIGQKLSGKKRSEVFISTKLSNGAQRRGDVRGALMSSLRKLGTDYVDLYLMHWPNPGTYLDSWKQMEDLYKEGFARAIGVCNFHQHHLEELFSVVEVMPAVNQIELHPLLSQYPLRLFCEQHKIQVQAYSPLARMNAKLINNPVLIELAQKYNKSVPQVIINWLYYKRVVSVPKSGNLGRLVENLKSVEFALTESDIGKIDALNEDFRVRFDPDNCDFSKL